MTTAFLKGARILKFAQRFQQSRSNSTYKAAVVKGDVKELLIEEQKRSKLKDEQVRIRVHYCSVNSADLPSFHASSKKLSFIPGYELAGEVIELGKKVRQDQLIQGERVAALSLQTLGGFAEECVLDVDDVFRLPSNVELRNAAVITSGYAMALFAFSKMYKLKKEHHVLITAGSAGLGLAAVDVASNVFGAKVIGVIESEETAELVRQKGAFKTIHIGAKLYKNVMFDTINKGADVVYDGMGGNVLESVGQCCAKGGQIIYVGPPNGKMIPAPPPNTYFSMLSLLDLRTRDIETYRCLVKDALDLADQGVIDAHISQRFGFSEINKAIGFIEDRKATGKILIKINN